MEDRIHLRLSNGVEMHQVSMVGKEVLVGAGSSLFASVVRLDIQIEQIA